MNRKSFLRRLGIGAVAVVIAPHVFLPKKPKWETFRSSRPFIAGSDPITPNAPVRIMKITTAGELDPESFRKYPMTYAECYKMPDYYPEMVRKYQRMYDEAWIKLERAIETSKLDGPGGFKQKYQ